MVCILTCSFKFSTSKLEFYSWILYFTLFLYSSHQWKTFLHLSFNFWSQLFYLTLLAVHFPLALSNYTVKPCNFQLDKQIFIHFYFLLVLMPEPVPYKRSLCGSGKWWPIDLLSRLFRPSCFLKKGVDRQQMTSTSSQNVWKCCSLCWNVKLILLQLKKDLRFGNLLQSAFWICITQRFSFVRECDDFLQCFVTLELKMKLHQLWRIALWLG